jgi:hypothetical protein
MDYDLGYFDDETCRLEPIDNPFGPKLLPMSPEWTVTHVPGIDRKNLEAPPGFEPGMEVLQTSALPLGDGADRNWGSKLTWDSRPRLWTGPTATSGGSEGRNHDRKHVAPST